MHHHDACRDVPNAHAQFHLHLLNDGRFPANVRLGLASQGGVQAAMPPATPVTSKTSAAAAAKTPAAAAKPGQAAGKGQAAPSTTPAAFNLSTQVMSVNAAHPELRR